MNLDAVNSGQIKAIDHTSDENINAEMMNPLLFRQNDQASAASGLFIAGIPTVVASLLMGAIADKCDEQILQGGHCLSRDLAA